MYVGASLVRRRNMPFCWEQTQKRLTPCLCISPPIVTLWQSCSELISIVCWPRGPWTSSLFSTFCTRSWYVISSTHIPSILFIINPPVYLFLPNSVASNTCTLLELSIATWYKILLSLDVLINWRRYRGMLTFLYSISFVETKQHSRERELWSQGTYMDPLYHKRSVPLDAWQGTPFW